MRALLPIVSREPAAWVFVALATVGVFLVALAPADLAHASAGPVGWLLASTAGALLVASVWGSAHAASLEQNAQMLGTGARGVRLRIFALLMTTVVGAQALALLVGLAKLWVAGQPLSDDQPSGRGEVFGQVLALTTPATVVALGTVLSWGRTRTMAIVFSFVAFLLPVIAQFGPRLSGRLLVLALSPTGAGAVLPAAAHSPAPLVAISALTLSAAWVACIAVLARRAPDEPVSSGDPAAQAARHARRAPRQRSATRWLIPLSVAAFVVAAFGPTLGETVPYERRPSTGVQQDRRTGPDEALATFLGYAAEREFRKASFLTTSGDSVGVLSDLPYNFAIATQDSPTEVVSSPTIRAADVEINSGARTFHACMERQDRRWLVASIQEATCE